MPLSYPQPLSQGIIMPDGRIARALAKLENFFGGNSTRPISGDGVVFSQEFKERYIDPRPDRQNMTPEDAQAISDSVRATFPESLRQQLGIAGNAVPLVPGTDGPHALKVLFQPNGEIGAFYKDKEQLPANVLACTPQQQQWLQPSVTSMPGMAASPLAEIGDTGSALGREPLDKGQIRYSANAAPVPTAPGADPRNQGRLASQALFTHEAQQVRQQLDEATNQYAAGRSVPQQYHANLMRAVERQFGPIPTTGQSQKAPTR